MSGLTELAMRLLIGAEDRTGPAAKSARQNVQSISDQLARFEVVAKRVLDLRLFVGFAKDSIELSDGYKALSGRITQVTKDTGNLAAKQAQLFDLAQDTQTGLGSTVNLFTKSAEALKNVQDGQEKALKLTEAVNLSFKAQALGTADIESTVRQLTQAIGTSNVQWEDFGQVADANLLLANVAAKNLGFDGLGALKQAMSNNQVTNTQLVDSIIGGLDEIKAASEAMPLTVQAAFTTLNNSVLRYVGESDAANKSTQAIAGSIRLLADNLNTVANAAVLVAEIYGTRVAIGLLKSAQGYVENAQAARASAAAAQQEAAAQQAQLALKEKLATVQLKIAEASLSNARASKAEAEAIQSKNTASKAELETEVQQIALKASLAKSRLASAAAAVEEAQLQRALAVSNEQQVAANRALALSVEHLRQSRSALSRANSEAVIYNGELAAANDRLTISEKRLAEANGTLSAEVKKYNTSAAASKAASAALGGGFGATAGEANKFDKAMTAVNWSINAWLAWDIGTTVGEWLRQFESVRIAGTYLAETFAIIASGIEGMFSGISIGERWAQIQKIHAEFSQIRQNETDQAITSQQNIEASEKAKAKAAEESAERQRIAYEKIKEATKQLTAIIDADAKQQAVSIKQQLAEREAAINAMDISDAERDRLRFVAQQLAADQEILLQRRVTEDKLALIDKQYNDEIQKAEANKTRVQQLEQEKRQAKLSVYQGLAEFYQGEVDRLQGVYANEEQLALQSRQQLQALAISHEAALFQIGLKGLDDREKISKEESRFNELIRRAREEQAKGEQADQDKINQLLTEARNLHQDITNTADKGSSEIYAAKERENKIYDIQKGVLENNAKNHEKNAERAKTALESTKGELAGINETITGITNQLKNELKLQIGIDQTSLANIRNVISELTKPETKVITIVTQNAGPGAGQGADLGQAADTGEFVDGFSTGGYTPRSGKLSGYGGGDKVRALLEAGEFIVRKEAVNKFGVDFMQSINAGIMPIRRAKGGLVDTSALSDMSVDDILALLKKLGEQKAVGFRRQTPAGSDKNVVNFRTATDTTSVLKDLLEQKFIIEKTRSVSSSLGSDNAADVDISKDLLTGDYFDKRAQAREAELPFLLAQLKNLMGIRRKVDDSWRAVTRRVQGGIWDFQQGKISEQLTREMESVRTKALDIEKAMQDVISHIKETGHNVAVNSGYFQKGFTTQGISAPFVLEAIMDGKPLKFAAGGKVPGTGSGDKVPALLTPGEWIINAASVRAFGPQFFEAINNSMAPVRRFNEGGFVGMPSVGSGGVVNVNLSLNGKASTGIFPKTPGTMALLDELKQASLVSS